MVLKEATVYTLCISFAKNRSTWLKFWHHVGIYKGHIWYEFHSPASLIVEVSALFVCF